MKTALPAVLVLLAALRASPASAGPVDKRLVGSWGRGGEVQYVLKADGTGTGEDGPFRWSVSGGFLLVDDGEEADRLPFRLEGGKLHVTIDGEPTVLERVGKKGSAAPPAKEAAKAGSDKLSTLLLSSAWCSFSYSKVSGTTKQSKVRFRRDGTWGSGARGETYSSGYGGTASGQSDSTDGGRWQVKGGRLSMSSSESPSLEPVDTEVKRNSNGYPILVADGVEYSQCN